MTISDIAYDLLGAPAARSRGPERGMDPSGFDCSGFVQFVLARAGVPPAEGVRHVNELFDSYGILVHDECRASGDLVFFSKNLWVPTHVGIYVGDGKMVHSPGRDGGHVHEVTIENYVRDTFPVMPAEQAFYARNPIGYKRPAIQDGRYRISIDSAQTCTVLPS